jgi:hypothetical protein
LWEGRGREGRGMWAGGSHKVKIRFFAPNPFSKTQKWTFIFVHFWKSQRTFGKWVVVTIMKNYRLDTKKIIQNL